MKKLLKWIFALSVVTLFMTFGSRTMSVFAYDSGETITGTFPAQDGYDVATVRYIYEKDGETVYGFADIKDTGSGYTYSFQAPSDGFTVVEGKSTDADLTDATVIAEYFTTGVWDGAVDVSWYNEEDSSFYIYTPAQLAGVAAIVNGSVDGNTPDYRIKGDQSFIESTYEEEGTLPAHGTGPLHKGIAAHDFANRTIYLMNDLDMGGADGSAVAHDFNGTSNPYNYPNWMPIGGSYLADLNDFSSMVMAFFNGTFDGNGHHINNLYCYRWNYGAGGSSNNSFCYCQGVGLFGAVGTLYSGEETPSVDPAIRNLSLSGYVYGRRMVGGIIGYAGGGSNSVESYNSVNSLQIENCANHAYVYNTDSKGVAGIIATAMVEKGNIINCYNTGNITTNYANPCGGIVGSNEGMNVYCCYNTGKLNTNGNSHGRGIGCNSDSGANYTVNNCYYLHGTNDDSTYPGYYTANLASSISVTVEEVSSSQVTNGELLALLNVNGTAYVTGSDGRPVLYWEANGVSTANVTLTQPEGGTVTADKTGTVRTGSIVYMTYEEETGFAYRYFTLNGAELTGHYATVTGDAEVSGVFEAVVAGALNIAYNQYCDITVTKTGTIEKDGEMTTVTDYPVASGDALYEGDVLTVYVSLHEDAVPDDEDLIFSAAAGLNNPYTYAYTYVGTEASSLTLTYQNTYTVNSHISEDGVQLLLDVTPLTTQKLWRYIGDTSWYNDTNTEFTLTTARQLAGVQVLVLSGEDFSGKTIKLGSNIAMTNDDGTNGKRFWDGIGNANYLFSGTFDGQGHSLTDLHVNMYGLFAYTEDAVIKDVSIYGDADGNTACGIAAYGTNTEISGCSAYSVITGTANYSAGILGKDQGGCSISNCYNYGPVSGIGKVGGIAGELSTSGTVYQCINQGDISCLTAGNYMVGGIAGSLNGKLEQCGNTGDVTSAGRNTGGIAGQSVSAYAKITDCYNSGTVTHDGGTSTLDSVGGIVGYGSYYSIENVHNYGAVIKASGSLTTNIGGVIGRDMKRSTNTTDNVYYNSDVNTYAAMSVAQDVLGDVSYWSGIKAATAGDFANAGSVTAAINGNESFQLVNGTYPQLVFESGALHVHSGGTATCVELAVCETCGLSYGELDTDNHGETEVVNVKTAAWTQDGYTGDTVCMDCGAVLAEGEVIPVDTTLHAFTVTVMQGEETVRTKEYTVAEFDALKSTETIGYIYGKSVMATDKYVTLQSIFSDVGVNESDFAQAVISGDGMSWTLTKDLYENSNKYYDSDGNESTVPAAIAIHWTTGSTTVALDDLLADAAQTDSLRFGYGITADQKENAPGNRLISPVNAMTITLEEEDTGVTVSGTITGYAGEGTPVVELIQNDETVYTASVTDGEYSIESVADGEYTLSVSADGDYVTHTYTITVSGEDLAQNVTIYELGDVNMDGRRTMADATKIGRHVSRLSYITDDYALLLADTSRDGRITMADATRMARFIARLISEL